MRPICDAAIMTEKRTLERVSLAYKKLHLDRSHCYRSNAAGKVVMGVLSNAEPECESHCSVGSEKHGRHHHTHDWSSFPLVLRGTVDGGGIAGMEPFLRAKSNYYSDRGENLEGQGGPLVQQLFCLLVDFDEERYDAPDHENHERNAGARNKSQQGTFDKCDNVGTDCKCHCLEEERELLRNAKLDSVC
jgi:hypothetical protein